MIFISLPDTQMAFEKPSRAEVNPHVWINSSNLMRDNSQPSTFPLVPTIASMLLLFSLPVEEEHLPPKIMLFGCTTTCPDSWLPCADLVVTVPHVLGWGTCSWWAVSALPADNTLEVINIHN